MAIKPGSPLDRFYKRQAAQRAPIQEEEDMGLPGQRALEEGQEIGEQFNVPEPEEAIPSPYTDRQGQFDRQAILDYFAKPQKRAAPKTAVTTTPTTTGTRGTRAAGDYTTPGGVGEEAVTGRQYEAEEAETGVPATEQELPPGVADPEWDRGEGWSTGEVMPGWDANKWGTQQSAKYKFGEIASRYPATDEGLNQVMNDPDFKRMFPNARRISGDKIDFGSSPAEPGSDYGVEVVDVLQAYEEGSGTSKGWWWGDQKAMMAEEQGLAPESAGGMAPGGITGIGELGGLGESDLLAQIMAEIERLAGGGEDPALAQAILQGLQGEVLPETEEGAVI
jgi:hypothetical protein